MENLGDILSGIILATRIRYSCCDRGTRKDLNQVLFLVRNDADPLKTLFSQRTTKKKVIMNESILEEPHIVRME